MYTCSQSLHGVYNFINHILLSWGVSCFSLVQETAWVCLKMWTWCQFPESNRFGQLPSGLVPRPHTIVNTNGGKNRGGLGTRLPSVCHVQRLVACTSLVQVQVFSYCELGNHWHKTPVAGIPSLVSSCCCNRNHLLFPPWHLITPVRERWLELLFKTLKCGLRCYFHRYIKEQSPSIYLLLDHQLDGWMLIVSLWTLIWLLKCYGELNLLNVCKF